MSLEQYLIIIKIFLTSMSFLVVRNIFKIPPFQPTLRFSFYFYLYLIHILTWGVIACMGIVILNALNINLIDFYPPLSPLINESLTPKFLNDLNLSEAELKEILEEKQKRRIAKETVNFWIVVPGMVFAATFAIVIYISGGKS